MIPLLLNLCLDWILLTVSFFLPVIKTYKSWSKNDEEYRPQWIVYWIIIALYISLKPIFLLNYIPFIWLLETAGCLWLSHPSFYGALYLHVVFIDPIFIDIVEKQIAPKIKIILERLPLFQMLTN
mmetsp:Transcript_24920/g.27576  ORF Transcript_24920/g.27576 Transcript_24920/m.27576 type:complete len:125 (+) Transcript_24920:30-404(+)